MDKILQYLQIIIRYRLDIDGHIWYRCSHVHSDHIKHTWEEATWPYPANLQCRQTTPLQVTLAFAAMINKSHFISSWNAWVITPEIWNAARSAEPGCPKVRSFSNGSNTSDIKKCTLFKSLSTNGNKYPNTNRRRVCTILHVWDIMSICVYVSCEYLWMAWRRHASMQSHWISFTKLRYLTRFRTEVSAVICKGSTIHYVARTCQYCSIMFNNPVIREYDRIYSLH